MLLCYPLQQISRLESLKRMSLACETSVFLKDWDLVARGVWRAYHILLPLLGIAMMGRLLFQVLSLNYLTAATKQAPCVPPNEQCLQADMLP